jgi:hypothetical protein
LQKQKINISNQILQKHDAQHVVINVPNPSTMQEHGWVHGFRNVTSGLEYVSLTVSHPFVQVQNNYQLQKYKHFITGHWKSCKSIVNRLDPSCKIGQWLVINPFLHK